MPQKHCIASRYCIFQKGEANYGRVTRSKARLNDIHMDALILSSELKKRKMVVKNDSTSAKRRKLHGATGTANTDNLSHDDNTKEDTPNLSLVPKPNNVESSIVHTSANFSVGEVVWAKIRGYPHWPARINWLTDRRAEVVWFNDYRRTKIYKFHLFKFLTHFDQFASKFNDTVGLQAAAQEGLMCLSNALNINVKY